MNSSIPLELLNAVGPAPEWKYEMRREAQMVLPSVFLGPYTVSRDLATLQSLKITHICCISESREAHIYRPRFPDQFTYLVLDIRDATDQNLISKFPDVMHFIDQALAMGGRVLVHCGDGLSRSPALVTAYAMAKYNMSSDDAFQFVQTRRFCVSPNMAFIHQLDAYEPICQARRAMAQYASDPSNRNSRRKRADSPEEEDSPMDGRQVQSDPDAQQRVPSWGGVMH
ncbi:hypothetical protein CROQUDRAFT_663019 [Cronartium quercuum f. sp. fusiforme G11]|uniref:Protein-tyrosine-phosphatase n=1 Tax=Cronartium quercuum f. sp. fusiforme G11 TaxID=708437 RepID=A0A9P6T7Z5_9BASI|nr:hypothetical protein CROQUDRAFT_663019 [Cronartium quercuum f. sp. fusiforme G11]